MGHAPHHCGGQTHHNGVEQAQGLGAKALSNPTSRLINNNASQNHRRGGSVRVHSQSKPRLTQGQGDRQGLIQRLANRFKGVGRVMGATP
jgi:hypothetical protein